MQFLLSRPHDFKSSTLLASHVTLAVSGPSLTVIGTVDIGKYTGSDERLVVNSGDVFAGTFFLSGGGGPSQAGKGVVEISGGSVVTKDFQLGASAGCTSILHVVGSKALANDVMR